MSFEQNQPPPLHLFPQQFVKDVQLQTDFLGANKSRNRKLGEIIRHRRTVLFPSWPYIFFGGALPESYLLVVA
jgi:hypothetical protein